jgi:NADPH2:quinone reductase
MKAVLATEIGPPEVLQLREVDDIEPGPNQVLVRVEYAGVNMLDTIERRGMYRVPPRETPYVPGVEGAGTVERVGEGVTGFSAGDRVSFLDLLSGSYAELSASVSDKIATIPDDIPLEAAAAMTITGLTAHYLVHEYAEVGPDTTVVVHAAAGGVGTMLTQWLKHHGARVIGTTSSRAKTRICRDNGCDEVIVYTEDDFPAEVLRMTNRRGADLILDGVGKATIPLDMQCVGPRGSIVLFGVPSGKPDPIEPFWLMMGRSVRLCGGDGYNWAETRQEIESRMGAVYDGYRNGYLKPNITEVASLEDAPRIHHALESRRSTGKFVLEVR